MDIQSELNRAKEVARSGDLAEARLILKEVLDQNPDFVEGWATMADMVGKPEHVELCLRRVLNLDPGNESAKRKLAVLKGEPMPVHAAAAEGREPDASPQVPMEEKQPLPASTPKPSASTKRQSTGSRRILEIFLIAIVAFTACCVVGLLIVPFDSLTPGSQAGSAAPGTEDVTAVIYENIRASNTEDIELYMSTIHSKSPAYNDTVRMLSTAFSQYDLSYRISDLEVIRQDDREAEVAFVLTTRKLRGPSFRDNRVTGEMILRVENGAWKIYNQEVDRVEYLD